MQHYVHTEPGHGHANEDAVGVVAHPDHSGVLLCALADGQGGQPGGGPAARLAVARCLEIAATYEPKRLRDVRSWYENIAGVDQDVGDDSESGFCTLIGLCVSADGVTGASSGDSMAMLAAPRQSTILTENQRKNPPIGSGAAYPVAFAEPFLPGSRLLMMSDGVWRYVDLRAIEETALNNADERVIDVLRDLQMGRSRALHDDFSVILVSSLNTPR